MAIPDNQLQTVQTYQNAELAWMLNSYWAISHANKKFNNFQGLTANLGDVVTFDRAPRATTSNGLIVNFDSSEQLVQNLICSQAANTSTAYTAQQFLFNVSEYMDRFGKSRILELGNKIEEDILRNFTSSVIVNNPQDPRFGQNIDAASGPYRFYGNGVTPINSFGQLAQACANFRSYGAAVDTMCGVIPLDITSQIVNSGLNQFATNRNNEMASSWELGPFAGFDWYESNLLPIHVAGTVGEAGTTLTLVSTNDPSGQNVTQLTVSGASASDANAIKAGDLLQFDDGVSGQPNMRFLTYIGHSPTNQPVQFRATADAGSDGAGNIVINIFPALVSAPTKNQNLNNSLSAGMEISTLPSHRAGALMSGNPLYLAMPKLPDETPFPTVQTTDPETGVSIRHYWGSQFGMNARGYVWDQIWGSTLVPENSMRLIFPLNQ